MTHEGIVLPCWYGLTEANKARFYIGRKRTLPLKKWNVFKRKLKGEKNEKCDAFYRILEDTLEGIFY
jgi:hypothetical protein